MRIGDLVKMKRGYSSHGVILDIGEQLCFVKTQPPSVKWVSVLWSDEGPSLEKARDLEVVSELSDEQLESVRGGMSPRTFSNWRAEVFNEGG